jgi:hypothetical protein
MPLGVSSQRINEVDREARIRMAKKTASESDETRLKKKVAAKLAENKSHKGDEALRSLQKRLRRAQRKRRAVALRKKNSASQKAAAAAK